MAYPNICILYHEIDEETGNLESWTVYGPYWDERQAEAGMMRLAKHTLEEFAKECAELGDDNPAEVLERLTKNTTQTEKSWQMNEDDQNPIGVRVRLEIVQMKHA